MALQDSCVSPLFLFLVKVDSAVYAWVLESEICIQMSKYQEKFAQSKDLLSHCGHAQLYQSGSHPWTIACQAPLSKGFSRQEHEWVASFRIQGSNPCLPHCRQIHWAIWEALGSWINAAKSTLPSMKVISTRECPLPYRLTKWYIVRLQFLAIGKKWQEFFVWFLSFCFW